MPIVIVAKLSPWDSFQHTLPTYRQYAMSAYNRGRPVEIFVCGSSCQLVTPLENAETTVRYQNPCYVQLWVVSTRRAIQSETFRLLCQQTDLDKDFKEYSIPKFVYNRASNWHVWLRSNIRAWEQGPISSLVLYTVIAEMVQNIHLTFKPHPLGGRNCQNEEGESVKFHPGFGRFCYSASYDLSKFCNNVPVVVPLGVWNNTNRWLHLYPASACRLWSGVLRKQSHRNPWRQW